MVINAYAKINLRLKVLGKREDGFHELESFMQAVSLHDDVDLIWTPGGEDFSISLSCDKVIDPAMKPEDNLAYRAAELARSIYHPCLYGHLDINITKRIPVAAGLAGGSADCAATLYGLSKLWKFELPYKLAAELGSDVPFCLFVCAGGSAALAGGRGEKLTETEPIKDLAVLLNPGYGLSTPAVYKAWDIMHEKGENSSQEGQKYFNDLELPALSIEPGIAEMLAKLKSIEPAPLHVQLSGSGPTCFALFDEKTDREILEKCLQGSLACAIMVEPLRKNHL